MRTLIALCLSLSCLHALAQSPVLTSSIGNSTGTDELPRLKWTGDIRVRGQIENNDNNDSRRTGRLRLRGGVKVQIEPDLAAEIRMATVRTNRSTNQTLGDGGEPGMPRRFIGLDLAYAEWSPLSFWKLRAGRIPQAHERTGGSQVILDEDISLEGAAMILEVPAGERWKIFANAGSVWIRENYDDYYSEEATDNMINWAQFGARWAGNDVKTSFGGGFFNFVGLQGRLFSEIGGSAGGNGEDPSGTFAHNYIPKQVFADVTVPWGATDCTFFLEHVFNDETRAPHRAWWTGIAASRKSWDARLAFGEIESDAVPAMFTFSDFANGTTDARGVMLTARWKFAKNLNLAVTQFANRLRYTTDHAQYNRTHLDLNASF